MTYEKYNKKTMNVIMNKIFFVALTMASLLLVTTLNLSAQSPTPTPASSEPAKWGDYDVTTSIELGVRGVSITGNDNKYKSDLNYRPGFRILDSSFRLETANGKGKAFDSMQLNFSGWGGDPSGFVRANVEKGGIYRLNANVRRVQLINRMSNFTLGYNRANTKRTFGDVDVTVFPERENLRFRFGTSFNRQTGDLGFTIRTRDVFPMTEKINTNTYDFRAGVDTKLVGFNLSFTAGKRMFSDNSKFVIESRNAGFVPTDINFITKLEKRAPNEGDTNYGMFSMHRTFAKRVDLTGRFIYSFTDRGFNFFENFSGEGPVSRTVTTPIFIDADIITVDGKAKRNQSRGDLGLTVAVTDKFRISNTFSFDQFTSYGDSIYAERVISRLQSTGVARPDTNTRSVFFHFYDFKRFTNTFEGDYQFNSRFGVNLAYRYSHREAEGETNSTNAFIFGMKAKPTKDWSIYADVERGTADNAFTRLANHDYINFRARSNYVYKKFNFNVSGIVKNNENPSFTSAVGLVPAGQLVANVRNRVFSAYVDWSPDLKWMLSSGYTYNYLSSKTDIVVPLAALTLGKSEFYMRDNYAFFDVSARPINRVSLYASYRFNTDKGQNDTISVIPQTIISSYPFTTHTPEFKVAIKLTKNIDWNIGYQYHDYKEKLNVGYFYNETYTTPTAVYTYLPNQNYRAHLPYTSLRIYFGGARDR